MQEGWWKLQFSETKAHEVVLGCVATAGAGQEASSALLEEGQGAHLILKEEKLKRPVMGGIDMEWEDCWQSVFNLKNILKDFGICIFNLHVF